MFPVLQYPNLILPSCPFCVAGDSESDSDFPLWVGFPHYLISPPAPWMDFSISWHAGNFLLAARQPHRANSLVLSLLVIGRFWCLPEDSFAVKKKKKKQLWDTKCHSACTQTYFLYSHVISCPATLALLLGSKTASLWDQSMSSTQGTMTKKKKKEPWQCLVSGWSLLLIHRRAKEMPFPNKAATTLL